MPKSATDVCNPKKPSSVSSMVLDGTSKHSIDLTDCQGESFDMATAADKNSTSSDANPCENKQVFQGVPLSNWKEGLKITLAIPKAHGLQGKLLN